MSVPPVPPQMSKTLAALMLRMVDMEREHSLLLRKLVGTSFVCDSPACQRTRADGVRMLSVHLFDDETCPPARVIHGLCCQCGHRGDVSFGSLPPAWQKTSDVSAAVIVEGWLCLACHKARDRANALTRPRTER